MTGFFIVIHVLICVLLIVIILAQSGRGGGLTEGFGAAESVFGAKTNEFMIRATGIAGMIFLITSLSLAYLSSRAERSLMSDQVEQQIPLEEVVDLGSLPELPAEVTSPETKVIDHMDPPVQVQATREVAP